MHCLRAFSPSHSSLNAPAHPAYSTPPSTFVHVGDTYVPPALPPFSCTPVSFAPPRRCPLCSLLSCLPLLLLPSSLESLSPSSFYSEFFFDIYLYSLVPPPPSSPPLSTPARISISLSLSLSLSVHRPRSSCGRGSHLSFLPARPFLVLSLSCSLSLSFLLLVFLAISFCVWNLLVSFFFFFLVVSFVSFRCFFSSCFRLCVCCSLYTPLGSFPTSFPPILYQYLCTASRSPFLTTKNQKEKKKKELLCTALKIVPRSSRASNMPNL